MDRKEAKLAGMTFFNSGKPCGRGHFADRYVSSGNCLQCHAERVMEKRATPTPKPAPIVPRAGVVILRNVAVPRAHLHAIRQVIDGFMAAEGLLPGPPPEIVDPNAPQPNRGNPATRPHP